MAADRACLSRRELLTAGARIVLLAPVAGLPLPLRAQRSGHAPKVLARLGDLRVGQSLAFDYPRPGLPAMLVRLGVPAGGGIGPDADVVAFSTRCTHLGGPLEGTLNAGHQVLGPCPRHLTSFDLTRHGVVLAGHATQALPQVVLELDGERIVAVGLQGLIFGDEGPDGAA
jgi:arsenite oxidase small subunit